MNILGGISGLFAGLKLAESGFKNIALYEASDRLGGRIQSVHYQGKLIY